VRSCVCVCVVVVVRVRVMWANAPIIGAGSVSVEVTVPEVADHEMQRTVDPRHRRPHHAQ
jgi:hypothetical protein